MSFANPGLLVLLPLIAILAALSLISGRRRARLIVADVSAARAAARPTAKLRLRWVPAALRWTAVVLIVVALARPREGLALTFIPDEGIDVVVTVDTSTSMTNSLPGGSTRIRAAREVVSDFVGTLEGDRSALVIFQSRALTLSPLTADLAAIKRRVNALAPGLLEDGTAIGLGLSEAMNLLRESPARSRVIVLLTDGQNNAGEVDPMTAARIAATLGIRLYTIGFVGGTFGGTSTVDALTLTKMAEATEGRYYDARTQDELAAAYEEIGALERSRIGERRFSAFRELAPPLIAAALGLLLVEALLRATWLRRHP